MKEERKIQPDLIHIIEVKTLKGNIENSEDEKQPQKVDSYRFEHKLGTGINVEDKIVALNLTINITGLNTELQETGAKGSYTHRITFKVENLSDFIDLDTETQDVKEIDLLMGATLAGIAYSTVRGIIYNRTQSTALNAVILPVIDPKDLFITNDDSAD